MENQSYEDAIKEIHTYLDEYDRFGNGKRQNDYRIMRIKNRCFYASLKLSMSGIGAGKFVYGILHGLDWVMEK